MATDVPTTNDVKNSVKDGAVPGLALSLGSQIGRGVLGRGFGTAVGGLAAASTQSGQDQQVMSIMAIDRGMNELMFGGGGGRRGQQGVK